MVIKWPFPLISDIARRHCVLMLGSGVSRNSQNATGARPKVWLEFLQHAITALGGPKALKSEIKRLLVKRDFLTACQVIRDHMGRADFHQLAVQEFLAPAFQAAEIHTRIMELDSRIVATPNFDTIYENHVNHLQGNSVAVKNYYDNDVAETIRGTTRIVLKIHGSINQPNRMIFTREDYARARSEVSSFYGVFAALVMTQTFIFVGCGLDDPDIRLILEDYAFKHEFSQPHYFVLPSTSIDKRVVTAIEKCLNIRILTYPVVKGDHGALVEAIKELRDLVVAERVELAQNLNW